MADQEVLIGQPYGDLAEVRRRRRAAAANGTTVAFGIGVNQLVLAACACVVFIALVALAIALVFTVTRAADNGGGGPTPMPTPTPTPPVADLTECGAFLDVPAGDQSDASACGTSARGTCGAVGLCDFTVFEAGASFGSTGTFMTCTNTAGCPVADQRTCFCTNEQPVCTRFVSGEATVFECRRPRVCGRILDLPESSQIETVPCGVGSTIEGECFPGGGFCGFPVALGNSTLRDQRFAVRACVSDCTSEGQDCTCFAEVCTRQLVETLPFIPSDRAARFTCD